jgi:hypothetical protein
VTTRPSVNLGKASAAAREASERAISTL